MIEAAQHGGLPVEGEEQMLGRQVFVGEVLTYLVGLVEDVAQCTTELRVRSVRVGQLAEHRFGLVASGDDIDLDPVEKGQHNALFLAEQRHKEMLGNHLGVGRGTGELGRRRERFGRFEGQRFELRAMGRTSVHGQAAENLSAYDSTSSAEYSPMRRADPRPTGANTTHSGTHDRDQPGEHYPPLTMRVLIDAVHPLMCGPSAQLKTACCER